MRGLSRKRGRRLRKNEESHKMFKNREGQEEMNVNDCPKGNYEIEGVLEERILSASVQCLKGGATYIVNKKWNVTC